jgi:hypothetical protein
MGDWLGHPPHFRLRHAVWIVAGIAGLLVLSWVLKR